jgi:hypothetical protein
VNANEQRLPPQLEADKSQVSEFGPKVFSGSSFPRFAGNSACHSRKPSEVAHHHVSPRDDHYPQNPSALTHRPRSAWVFPVGSDPVADYVRLAAIPRENVSEVEAFLRRQEAGSDTLAVLERPGNQPVALLKIHAGDATLFSFLPSQEGRSLIHETFIGKIYDATITQVHAVENLADVSASKPESVEIAGSRLGGTINLTNYSAEQRAALMDALREIIPR